MELSGPSRGLYVYDGILGKARIVRMTEDSSNLWCIT